MAIYAHRENEIVKGFYNESDGKIYKISTFDKDNIPNEPRMVTLDCHNSNYIDKHYSEFI